MYFNDLKLGMSVEIAPAVIEKQKMMDFAYAYDNIPLHTDEAYAKASPFGALIAPRYFFQLEGMQDPYVNPIGAWQNICAVKACYRYLGCEERAAAWFRGGGHRHKLPDFAEFMEFMDRARAGRPLAEQWCMNPYPDVELMVDAWEKDKE